MSLCSTHVDGPTQEHLGLSIRVCKLTRRVVEPFLESLGISLGKPIPVGLYRVGYLFLRPSVDVGQETGYIGVLVFVVVAVPVVCEIPISRREQRVQFLVADFVGREKVLHVLIEFSEASGVLAVCSEGFMPLTVTIQRSELHLRSHHRRVSKREVASGKILKMPEGFIPVLELRGTAIHARAPGNGVIIIIHGE